MTPVAKFLLVGVTLDACARKAHRIILSVRGYVSPFALPYYTFFPGVKEPHVVRPHIGSRLDALPRLPRDFELGHITALSGDTVIPEGRGDQDKEDKTPPITLPRL